MIEGMYDIRYFLQSSKELHFFRYISLVFGNSTQSPKVFSKHDWGNSPIPSNYPSDFKNDNPRPLRLTGGLKTPRTVRIVVGYFDDQLGDHDAHREQKP